MEKFIINPENYQEEYIRNLNECFNGWGGKAEYDWVFNRKVGEHTSDILLIENEEDGVIAGSAITYRQLSGKEKSPEIGIMTGSWTLPAARRKGCFTKMINCSKDLCKKKGVPFLTAFVTEKNPSCRRLESEGSFMFPTYHLFSPENLYEHEDLSEPVPVQKNEELVRAVYDRTRKTQEDLLNFSYNKEEFSRQYIRRIKETVILKINNDYAILEDGVNEVKVLLLTHEREEDFRLNMQALTNWCLTNRSKKAFFFTTRKELFTECTGLGFSNLPGYFTILNVFDEKVSFKKLFQRLNINMADKM